MTETMTKGPLPGSPESADWFRAKLADLEQTQSGFARLLADLGDDRQPATILRSVQRMATGEARISGELRVVINLLEERGVRQRAMAMMQEGKMRSGSNDGSGQVDTTLESIARTQRELADIDKLLRWWRGGGSDGRL